MRWPSNNTLVLREAADTWKAADLLRLYLHDPIYHERIMMGELSIDMSGISLVDEPSAWYGLRVLMAIRGTNKLIMRRALLRGVDLNRMDIEGADMAGVDFSGANLSGANLRAASFADAIMVGTNLCDVVNAEYVDWR